MHHALDDTRRWHFDSNGITIGDSPGTFNSTHAYKFGRDTGFGTPGAGDTFGLYTQSSGGSYQDLTLLNTADRSSGGGADAKASVQLVATGWKSAGNTAADITSLILNSDPTGTTMFATADDVTITGNDSLLLSTTALTVNGTLKLNSYTGTTFVAGDKYLVIDAAGNVHRSAIGPAS
jgi:hypothetical protein